MTPQVAAFFYVRDKIIGKSCSLAAAEKGGDFLNYPESHFEIWEDFVQKDPALRPYDYDFFPRGRIVYNQCKNIFIVYVDRCIHTKSIKQKILAAFDLDPETVRFDFDEHYQCHVCNKYYHR